MPDLTPEEIRRLQEQHRQQAITIGLYQYQLQEHRKLMRQFVEYWLRDGGCGMCGGVPHSTTCYVGRMEFMLKAETHV